MACAPWLPPKTSKVGRSRYRAARPIVKESLPHRHARDLSVAKILCCFLKMNCRRRDPARDDAIGKTRHNVGLECQSRDALSNRRQHGRAGSVSANPDDHVWLKRGEHSASGKHRRGAARRRFSAAWPGSPDSERPTFISCSGIPSRRNQPVLDPARRSDEKNFRAISFLQFIGDGKRRNDMAAGPAPSQNGTHAVTINYALS